MPSTYIDPLLSDEEKAYKLRQLYPQMFVNSTDPNYPGGFGQNIDYDNLPADEGTDPSALGKAGTGDTTTPVTQVSAVGSPGTGAGPAPGSPEAAAELSKTIGPNAPAAAQIPKEFMDAYGGWGGDTTSKGPTTTADGAVDPMGGWGGTPNATPPKTPPKASSNWEREPTDAEKSTGTVVPNIGGPLGVPDTTATSAATTSAPAPGAAPAPAYPKAASGKYTSPTGALGTGFRGEDQPPVAATTGGGVYSRPHGTLPNFPPPAPATRLQPGIDRAALYQQLRPYPGISRAEKLSNMLASAFGSAALPGTGNSFKDAARGFAMGSADYQKMSDAERALRAQYATSVLGQVAGQEEAARKAADTAADIYKKGGEGFRAYSYGGYLGDRGQHMLTQLGPAALMNAETAKTQAQTAATKAANDLTVVGPGSVAARVVNGRVVPEIAVPANESAQQQQTRQAVFLVNAREEILGRKLTPDEWDETMRFGLRGYEPAGSTGQLAQIQAISKLPPEQQGPAMAKLKADVKILNDMNPPKQTILQMPLGETVKGKGISEVTQRHVKRFTGKDGVVDYQKYIAAVMNGELDKTGYTQVRDVDWQNSLLKDWQDQNQARKTSGPPPVVPLRDRTGAGNKKKEQDAAAADPAAAAVVQNMLKMKREREARAKAAKGVI